LNGGQYNETTMKTKKTKRNGKPDPAILADVIKRIVEVADPERIVLFGSAARGTMGPDSDLDLLVIKAGKFNSHRVTRDIYRNMSGDIGVDAIVVTPEDVERYRDSFCLVICPALKEGKVVYEAKAVPAGRSARMDSPRQKQPGVGPKRPPRR
jgi:uncharacterized protein